MFLLFYSIKCVGIVIAAISVLLARMATFTYDSMILLGQDMPQMLEQYLNHQHGLRVVFGRDVRI